MDPSQQPILKGFLVQVTPKRPSITAPGTAFCEEINGLPKGCATLLLAISHAQGVAHHTRPRPLVREGCEPIIELGQQGAHIVCRGPARQTAAQVAKHLCPRLPGDLGQAAFKD